MPRLLACYQLLEYMGFAKFSLSPYLFVCVCVLRDMTKLVFPYLFILRPLEDHIIFFAYLQVSIPLGLYDNLPVAISLLAKHGSDGFLLNLVEIIYDTLQEEVGITEKRDY